MTVRLDGFVHRTFHEKQRRDGTVLGTFNEHYSIRYTNVATGRWLLTVFNGINKDLRVIDEGDGIITVVVAVAGIERMYAPDGTLLFKAAGTIRRGIRIDLTDRDDPDDDVMLDDQLVKWAGLRHGVADCDALRALWARRPRKGPPLSDHWNPDPLIRSVRPARGERTRAAIPRISVITWFHALRCAFADDELPGVWTSAGSERGVRRGSRR
jgi:hypothetical protein